MLLGLPEEVYVPKSGFMITVNRARQMWLLGPELLAEPATLLVWAPPCITATGMLT